MRALIVDKCFFSSRSVRIPCQSDSVTKEIQTQKVEDYAGGYKNVNCSYSVNMWRSAPKEVAPTEQSPILSEK